MMKLIYDFINRRNLIDASKLYRKHKNNIDEIYEQLLKENKIAEKEFLEQLNIEEHKSRAIANHRQLANFYRQSISSDITSNAYELANIKMLPVVKQSYNLKSVQYVAQTYKNGYFEKSEVSESYEDQKTRPTVLTIGTKIVKKSTSKTVNHHAMIGI